MTCPKCGAARPAGAVECPECGIIYARFEQKRERQQQEAQAQQEQQEARREAIRASAMIDCPVCGKHVSRLAPTCPHCGTPIFGTVPLPPVLEEAEQKKAKRTKRIIYVCVGLFILYCFTLPWSSDSSKSGRTSSPVTGEGVPVGTRTIDKDVMGCRDIEDLKRLTDLAVARDREAFSKAMVNYTAAGRCRLFKGGETVYTEDTKMLQGAIKVRIAGEMDSWWISL